MSRLHKKQLDLEEERNMFEEGNDMVLEGLLASMRGMSADSSAAATRAQAYRWGARTWLRALGRLHRHGAGRARL